MTYAMDQDGSVTYVDQQLAGVIAQMHACDVLNCDVFLRGSHIATLLTQKRVEEVVASVGD